MDGIRILPDVPLHELLADDEADYAVLDTILRRLIDNDPDKEISAFGSSL